MKQSINQCFRAAVLVFPAVLCMLPLLFCVAGCATSGSDGGQKASRPVQVGDVIARAPESNSGSAAKELATARRMIKAGESSLVIPRLQSLVNTYPGDASAIEARFFLGKAFYTVGAYSDAHRWLQEYLVLVPEGENSAEGRQLLEKLAGGGESEKVPGDDALAALEAAIAADPEAMAPRLDYANTLWEKGRYDQAGKAYDELLKRWPQLASDAAVSRRVERNPSGRLVVLSPAEMERRYQEAEPLLIYNVSSFRSGRFEGWPATAREKFYNVAGQAVNQSERPLEDVRITVTIYGFGQMVYDTQTISLGVLRPREIRAFNAQFSRFDDIHNITRHECVGSYRR